MVHPARERRIEGEGRRVEVQGARQEVDAEVASGTGPQQVLDLLVGLVGGLTAIQVGCERETFSEMVWMVTRSARPPRPALFCDRPKGGEATEKD